MYDFRLIQLNLMHCKKSRFSFNFISNHEGSSKKCINGAHFNSDHNFFGTVLI